MWRVNEAEGGSVAVIVALLLFSFIGIAALVVDVGRLYQERRELQNGADAAALAIAHECAAEDLFTCISNTSPGSSVLGGVAEPYAEDNASDGEAAVPDLMSHGGSVDSCELGADNVPNPLTDGEKVKVSTETLNNGNSFLTHLFAPVLDIDTGTVRACAVASWGSIGGATTIPIALCEDSWSHWTGPGGNLPSGPPAHPIVFNSSPGGADPEADCDNPSGDHYPGGFGFLERNEDCVAVTGEDNMVDGKTGNNPNIPDSPCSVDDMYQTFQAIIDGGETGLIPIFDRYEGEGAAGQFHIIGYGALKFQGYNINGGPGGADKTYNMPNNECTGSASCLKGYFTEFVALGAIPGGNGPDFGATGVFLVE